MVCPDDDDRLFDQIFSNEQINYSLNLNFRKLKYNNLSRGFQ